MTLRIRLRQMARRIVDAINEPQPTELLDDINAQIARTDLMIDILMRNRARLYLRRDIVLANNPELPRLHLSH